MYPTRQERAGQGQRQYSKRLYTQQTSRRGGSRTQIRASRRGGLNDSVQVDPEAKFFDDRNHVRILCRLKGSVWPQVIPYCLLNTIFAAVLWYFVKKRGIYFDFSQDANGYMASLLSFLVVSRVRMIYNQSMFSRNRLTSLCKSCEELVQNAAMLTSHNESKKAQKWRESIAYTSIVLLKQTMEALRIQSELSDMELTVESQNEGTENFRKPVKIAYKLRKKVIKHALGDTFKHEVGAMAMLTKFIDQYTAAFYEIEGISRASFPFPIVQMARTILFIWLSVLPLGLCQLDYPLWGLCMLIFLLTFGFLGLEYVSIEMSDPFGVDTTDHDLFAMAQITFENIYVMIFNVDGKSAAERLVSKVRKFSTLEEMSSISSGWQ